MLDRNNLLALMKTVAKADVSAPTSYSFNGESFSYEALNETLRRELSEYASDYASYRENKNLIFSITAFMYCGTLLQPGRLNMVWI